MGVWRGSAAVTVSGGFFLLFFFNHPASVTSCLSQCHRKSQIKQCLGRIRMKMVKVIRQAMKANKPFSFDLRGPARRVIAERQDEKQAEGSGVDSVRRVSNAEKPVRTLLVLTEMNSCQVSICKNMSCIAFKMDSNYPTAVIMSGKS